MKEKITYEMIEEANKCIKPMTIERKDKNTGKIQKKGYAEVHQRLKAFRIVYPMGCIFTEFIELKEDSCVIKAYAYADKRDETSLLATATAGETKAGSYINKDNYIENCETSAVGRVLGFCGFGIETSIATADDMKKVDTTQDDNEPMTKEQIDKLAYITNEQRDIIRNFYNKDPFKLTKREAEATIRSLEEKGLLRTEKDILTERKKKEEVF